MVKQMAFVVLCLVVMPTSKAADSNAIFNMQLNVPLLAREARSLMSEAQTSLGGVLRDNSVNLALLAGGTAVTVDGTMGLFKAGCEDKVNYRKVGLRCLQTALGVTVAVLTVKRWQ